MECSPKVIRNTERCDTLAELIKKLELPSDQEDKVEIKLPDDIAKNFYLALVAICHQTTPLRGPPLEGKINGIKRRGWDYLREKLLEYTIANPQFVSPKSLANLKSEDILSIYQGSTITDPEGRAFLLNDLGNFMQKQGWENIQGLYDLSEGFLKREDDRGLLKQLSLIKAYSDPLMKKSLFFLSLMRNHGFWQYKDMDNFGAPVDYHEVRGHLRLNTVEITDQKLKEKVLNREEVSQEEDISIRAAVFDAIGYISKETGHNPSILHYFFWNMFRNCCTRESPHCYECIDCKLPERYALLKEDSCLFNEICGSAGLEQKFIEHKVDTNLY